jgi:signal transduction histidine kinase
MRTALDVTLAKVTHTPEQISAMEAKLRRSIDQAERTIEALLVLARSDQVLTNREFVDLATAAEDAIDLVATSIGERDLSIEATLDPAEVTGDRVLLERMVANMVDNAVRHNVDDGWIRVRTGARNGHAFLEIANSGSHVPEAGVPALFEPFQRGEGRTRTGDGVGVGLSIVQSVALAHGARVVATSRAEGGLSVCIELPHRVEAAPA